MRRFRRPQLALIGLVVALAIGYLVRALTSDGSSGHPAPAVTAPANASSHALGGMPALSGMSGSGREMLQHVRASAVTAAPGGSR